MTRPLPRPPTEPEPEVDPADALARLELAAPSGSGAGYRPGDPDPLAEGLLMGYRTFVKAAARAALPAEAGPHLRDEAAEREAIPRQSNWRPPAWAEAEEAPRPGDWCGCCKRGWWWRPARPRTDGLAPGPGWRCAVCHPVPPGCETAEART